MAQALQTDLAWVKEHTRLAELAHRWEERRRPGALLLRGQELEEAESWIASRPRGAPEPTTLHLQILEHSRKTTSRRQRYAVLGSLAVAAVALGLTALALWQREAAIRNESLAVAARQAEATQRASAEKNEKQAKEERDRALVAESRFLSDFADRTAANHDSVSAALIALEGLPDQARGRPRPYVTEAEHSLYKAYVSIREKLIFKGHNADVFSVVLSPDGKSIATASKDGPARIFDVSSGRTLAVLKGHSGRVLSVAFAPDGRRLVTASLDRTARVWDASSGAQLLLLEGHGGGVHQARFSNSGGRIVTASSDNTARVWDAESGKPLHSLDAHLGIVWDAAFDPEGRAVATASMDNRARLWDAASGNLLYVLGGHRDQVSGMRFSPDGKLLLARSKDKTARIWTVASGDLAADLVAHEASLAVAKFSPDGATVVTASDDGDVRLWRLDGQPKFQLPGHLGRVRAAEFSASGRLLATAGDDATIRVWDVTTGRLQQELRGHTGSVSSVIFVGDDHLVSGSDDATARLWSLRPINVLDLVGHKGALTSASFSRDGRLAITTSMDRTARIWDAISGAQIAVLGPHSEPVFAAAFSPDGKRAFIGYGHRVQVWDVEKAAELAAWAVPESTPGMDRGVSRLALSSDGTRLAVATSLNVGLFDAASGKLLKTMETKELVLTDLQFSRDGASLLTAGLGPLIRPDGSVDAVISGAARLWSVATGAEIRLIERQVGTMSAAFFANGSSVVTISERGWLRLWSVESGSLMATHYLPHADGARESSDGSMLAISRFEQPALLKRTLDGGTVGSVSVVKRDELQFSPDGKRAIAAHEGLVARVWPVFKTTDDLLSRLSLASPRCLTIEQRSGAFLGSEPPSWCFDHAAWPYDDAEWREWNALRRLGLSPALPDERGTLRIATATMTEDMAKSRGVPFKAGVIVSEVYESGAGERAGLRPGDVITRISGKEVQTSEQLVHDISWKGHGTSVGIDFIRDGSVRTAIAVLDRIQARSERFDAGGSPIQDNSHAATYWGKERRKRELAAGDQLLAKAHELGDLNNFVGALRVMDQAISHFMFIGSSGAGRVTEEKRDERRKLVADWLNQQAWWALLSQQFRRALIEAKKAIALDPTNLDWEVNYAHALLFNDQTDMARSIYSRNRGKVLSIGKSWESVILEDFAALEKSGSRHDAIGAVSAILQAKSDGIVPSPN